MGPAQSELGELGHSKQAFGRGREQARPGADAARWLVAMIINLCAALYWLTRSGPGSALSSIFGQLVASVLLPLAHRDFVLELSPPVPSWVVKILYISPFNISRLANASKPPAGSSAAASGGDSSRRERNVLVEMWRAMMLLVNFLTLARISSLSPLAKTRTNISSDAQLSRRPLSRNLRYRAVTSRYVVPSVISCVLKRSYTASSHACPEPGGCMCL